MASEDAGDRKQTKSICDAPACLFITLPSLCFVARGAWVVGIVSPTPRCRAGSRQSCSRSWRSPPRFGIGPLRLSCGTPIASEIDAGVAMLTGL